MQRGVSAEELPHHPTTDRLLHHPQDDVTPGLEPSHAYVGRGLVISPRDCRGEAWLHTYANRKLGWDTANEVGVG